MCGHLARRTLGECLSALQKKHAGKAHLQESGHASRKQHPHLCLTGGQYGIREYVIWVVLKIMVPFWVPIVVRHLIFRVPKTLNHNFDNHPI